MTRKTAEKRIEKMVAKQSEQVKINARFDIQRAFGAEETITPADFRRLIERVVMQIKG